MYISKQKHVKIKHRIFRFLFITNMLVLFSGYMFSPIYALFVEKIGGNMLDAGLASSVFGITGAIVTLFIGRFVDKTNTSWIILALGYSLKSIAFLVLFFVNNVVGLIIVQVLLGMGGAIVWPPFDKLYTRFMDKNKIATAWGMWEAMDYFVGAIGAGIGGALTQFLGFKVLFLIMSFITLVSAIGVWYIHKKI